MGWSGEDYKVVDVRAAATQREQIDGRVELHWRGVPATEATLHPRRRAQVSVPGEAVRICQAAPIAAAAGHGSQRGREPMTDFSTKRLPIAPDAVAPDGSDVRLLLTLPAGGMAHFALPPGQTSTAVTHRTVAEIWFFLSGRGEMWRMQGEREEIVPVEPGVSLTIPLGTRFQFRSFSEEPLAAMGVTMPPWPGEGEAMVVPGRWEPTVPRPAPT